MSFDTSWWAGFLTGILTGIPIGVALAKWRALVEWVHGLLWWEAE